MTSGIRTARGAAFLICSLCVVLQASFALAEWRVDVSFPESVRKEPFTGRVLLFFTDPNDPAQRGKEPRLGPNWFRPGQFVARDVTNWKPGETVTFASTSPDELLSYPVSADKLTIANFRVQAVARFNPWERTLGTAPGNGYSQVADVPPDGKPVSLVVDKLVAERPFEETKWTKLLTVRSTLLSDFYGRDVYLRAAVVLPASYYDQQERKYPTIFSIPGFGGTHFDGRRTEPIPEKNAGGVEFLRVYLDPSCPLGHHVFADSENNGPCGTALVKEFLPAYDTAFRSIDAARGRMLTGHSSGGWSSLWVMITWPDVFAGVWSTSPDPVDFRDFQQINLYRPGENMYVDAAGKERPLARMNGKVVLWYRGFTHMEDVCGPGGQLHSFEAVFSPRGADGKPLLLWDRKTGAINTDVAKTWEKYDIRVVLERNWKTLGPKLAGKIHVDMGDQDTFYLEGATIKLKESLERLGSDAVVRIHPGKDHGSILSPDLISKLRGEMVERVLAK